MDEERPLKVGAALLASGLTVLMMLAVSMNAWFRLPEGGPVCMHWNAVGV